MGVIWTARRGVGMRRVNDEDEARRDTMNLHQISDYSIVHGMLLEKDKEGVS
jgi:hypothetical protein